MAHPNTSPAIAMQSGGGAPTLLGQGVARIPTGGKIRAGIKVLTKKAAGEPKAKAIYEQGLLSDEEKQRTLLIIKKSGADYVKISNALTGAKACMNDVKFVRSIVGPGIGIKIDGGIKDAKTASILLDSGANRLGCSASVQIVTE